MCLVQYSAWKMYVKAFSYQSNVKTQILVFIPFLSYFFLFFCLFSFYFSCDGKPNLIQIDFGLMEKVDEIFLLSFIKQLFEVRGHSKNTWDTFVALFWPSPCVTFKSKAALRRAFYACVYCMHLRFQRNYLGWLKPR